MANADKRRVYTSRFAGGQVVIVDLERDGVESIRYVPELREPLTRESIGDDYRIYYTIEGDQLDALAFRYLGDSRLWWVLADLNRDVLADDVLDTLMVPIGIKFVIPNETIFAVSG